jgi:hypothetical protein
MFWQNKGIEEGEIARQKNPTSLIIFIYLFLDRIFQWTVLSKHYIQEINSQST